jgi:hypothetical protein
MMNYHAKYNIGECSFNKITNPALVGIFSYENEKTPPSLDDPSIDIEVRIRRSITIGSYLGGGAGFPDNKDAVNIITKEHLGLLETFIKTIPQEKLYFFDDGTRLSIGMMLTLVQISKKLSKHVACYSILPASFNKVVLKRFNSPWKVISELADESYIFDFESTNIYQQQNKSELTLIMYLSLRWNEALKQIAEAENGFDSFDYYSKR